MLSIQGKKHFWIKISKYYGLYFVSLAPKAQGKKTTITSSDRAAVFLELADAHMEAGQLVNEHI